MSVLEPPAALLVDLYELTMGRSYLANGMAEQPATFQLFARTLPAGWGYFVAAGLDDVLGVLERLRFGADDLAYLEETRLFDARFLERLESFRFGCDIRALPEGTLFFPQEPVVEVTGPLLEAQLVETIVLNQVHFQSVIASKAARLVEAAQGRRLVDFAARRTHGAEAALKVARSSFLAGFDATSNVLAGKRYGIPIAGTMAHSYVECFEDEQGAFASFLDAYPDATLLVDTYDTLDGVRAAIEAGVAGGVRLDSGDLLALSQAVRALLDGAGLHETSIFASGSLDERELARLLAAGAPIDGFGIGSRLGVSADAPYLDMAYKLVAYDGQPVLKLSEGKATLPGSKQVWRRRAADGRFAGDEILLADEPGPSEAEPLLVEAMAAGRRTLREPLEAACERAEAQRKALPPRCRELDAGSYHVGVSRGLVSLRDELARRRRPRRRASGVAIVAHKAGPANELLADAWRALGLDAQVLAPDEALEQLGAGDVALLRLDVLPSVDGFEPGLGTVPALRTAGVRILNPPAALVAAHDKLETALRLEEAGLPHPPTVHVLRPDEPVQLEPPFVVKPRFGSWGVDVFRCESEVELRRCLRSVQERSWFRKQGALVQRLLAPPVRDLRVIVAGGRVIGIAAREPAGGEWRTNISLGGRLVAAALDADAEALALDTVAALGGDLVGVDLLPLPDGGYVVLELNGAVEFDRRYSLPGDDVFAAAAAALGLVPAAAALREPVP